MGTKYFNTRGETRWRTADEKDRGEKRDIWKEAWA